MERTQQNNEGLVFKVTALGTNSIWFMCSKYEGCQKYWDDIIHGIEKPEQPLMMTVTDTYSNTTIVLKVYL